MKKLIVTVCALGALTATSFAAAPAAAVSKRSAGVARREQPVKLTEAERAERRERIRRATGGMILKPGSMQGKIAFVNAQKKVPVQMLTNDVAALARQTRFNIVLEEGAGVTLATASAALRKNGANFAIFLVEDDSLPTLLTAPEERWAIVNVTALAKDGKPLPFVSARLRKEMARAYVFLCGGVSTRFKNSLIGGISKPSDLDEIIDARLPMDVVGRTVTYLPWFGVTRAIHAEYIDACEQGWAPPPADEYQKAIWDKVHQAPTAPIVIKPEPAKK